MSDQVEVPTARSCHCTDGVGVPEADAVTVALAPTATDWLSGWLVTDGATGSTTYVKGSAVFSGIPTVLVPVQVALKTYEPAFTPVIFSVAVPAAGPEMLTGTGEGVHVLPEKVTLLGGVVVLGVG